MKNHIQNLVNLGWTKVENVYDKELVEKIKIEFDKKKNIFFEEQKKKGIDQLSKNATHHTIIHCDSLFELLKKNIVHELLSAYFNGKYILSTMGISEIVPNQYVYTQKIHRDIRTFDKGSRLWINTLLMLDDSTEKNGATLLLEGSHLSPNKPNEEDFYKNSKRLTGKAGDVLLFDGNAWHAAGQNKTTKRRVIVTPIFCRPFIKQQINYPKIFDHKINQLDEFQKQLIGFNSLVPNSLDEFYQKPENRFYKSNQG